MVTNNEFTRRDHVESFADFMREEGLETAEEAAAAEHPHDWFLFFKKYNALFEDQITLIIFQCGITAEAFYEHVEERADAPRSADDLAFIATVKATLDFKDYIGVMIDEATNRRFTTPAGGHALIEDEIAAIEADAAEMASGKSKSSETKRGDSDASHKTQAAENENEWKAKSSKK